MYVDYNLLIVFDGLPITLKHLILSKKIKITDTCTIFCQALEYLRADQ